jgi:hypothetical protein
VKWHAHSGRNDAVARPMHGPVAECISKRLTSSVDTDERTLMGAS